MDDAAKVSYMTKAVEEAADVVKEPELMDPDLIQAVDWARGRTPQDIMTRRTSTLRAIRKFAAELAREGQLDRWDSSSIAYCLRFGLLLALQGVPACLMPQLGTLVAVCMVL